MINGRCPGAGVHPFAGRGFLGESRLPRCWLPAVDTRNTQICPRGGQTIIHIMLYVPDAETPAINHTAEGSVSSLQVVIST